MLKIREPYTSFKNALKFYKPQDLAQQALHFGAAATVMGAVGWWVGPLTMAGCAVAAGGITLGANKLGESIFKNFFKEHEVQGDAHKDIKSFAKEFTKAAGLRLMPTLKDMQFDYEKSGKKKDMNYQLPQLRRVLNAAVGGSKDKYLLVSQPLIDALDSGQSKAVIGHEFAHLGAGHIGSSKLMGWLQTTTMLAGMFTLGAAVVSTGWLVGAAAFAASMGIFYAGHKMMPDKRDSYTRDGELKPKAKAIELGTMAAEEVLSTAVLAVVNPIPVLTAYAVEQTSFWSALLINKSHSRRHEFQADREAVRLGANPLDLVTSLRTIEKALEIQEPEIAASRNWRKGSLTARFLKASASITKTHPDTLRRCNRLVKEARKLNYTEMEIDRAMKEPIDEVRLRAILEAADEPPPRELSEQEVFEMEKRALEYREKVKQRALKPFGDVEEDAMKNRDPDTEDLFSWHDRRQEEMDFEDQVREEARARRAMGFNDDNGAPSL